MIKPYFLATTHKREKKEPRNPTRDRGVVRNLRIWLQKKTAKIFMNKAEYVGCAACATHTWRVFYSCFIQGAWRCLF